MSAPPNPDPLPHRTVLAAAAVEHLVTERSGVYVDATFGRGGHTSLLLQALSPAARVFAFDRDPEAEAAAQRIADARFRFERTRFSRMQSMLARHGVTQVDGVLLDLGISSPQIDDPARGFSLRASGPLDMRMDPDQGESAAQWLGRASVDELTRVIRDYGEERFAASIAKALVARRAAGWTPASTADLAAVVADAIPVRSRKDAAQHPATRTFQAVRIFVNQELEELALVLEQVLALLRTGGRLVVISFHSLEDRIVKRFIQSHAHPDRAFARLPLRAHQLPQPRLRALAKVMPAAAEVAANPRARSAVMRVAERTATPWGDGSSAGAAPGAPA
jgi:16S rRNA (cytosine1402-N4)-methyltransferase